MYFYIFIVTLNMYFYLMNKDNHIIIIINRKSTKRVRDGILVDSTGSIKISAWGMPQVDQLEDGNFYTLANCEMYFYYGKCLATSKRTLVSKADSQDNNTSNQYPATKSPVLPRYYEC